MNDTIEIEPPAGCDRQWHGVDREDTVDGVVITLVASATRPGEDRRICGRTRVPSTGYIESGAALSLVRAHLGENSSPVWRGRGWSVEVTGRIFQVTS